MYTGSVDKINVENVISVNTPIIYVRGSYIRCWNYMHCCCSERILSAIQQLPSHTTQSFPAVTSNNGAANRSANDTNASSQGCPYKDRLNGTPTIRTIACRNSARVFGKYRYAILYISQESM